MLKYLKNIHQLRSATDLVVLGNQSADMDSCCSALMAAYLHSTLNGEPSIPLIQIPSRDMKLRKDIEFVFGRLGIDESWLLFTNTLPTTNDTRLFMVDHNAPSLPGTPVAVIDHHAIEDPTLDLSSCVPDKIVKSGSCMSAVINYFTTLNSEDLANASLSMQSLFESDPVLAPLALAPILQDTANLTHKVEQEDLDAVAWLKEHGSLSLFSPFAEFATMKEEKRNLDGLSAVDLLRKDYKQWGDIGISSLPKLLKKLAKLNLDVESAVVEYADDEKLALMTALTSGTSKDTYKRELVIWGPHDFDVAKTCPDLQLELVNATNEKNGNIVRTYNQLNTAASRKQIAPDLRRAYAAYKH